ncbi:MAG TPA: hypothetical protein ENK57_04870, partial [Polyangiaceae bacterium]|nr:hypothetical protein [Polyangiaceae bacterium]
MRSASTPPIMYVLVAALGACGSEPSEPAPPDSLGSLPPRPDTAACDFGGQPPSVVQEVVLSQTGIVSPGDVVAAAPFADILIALTGDGRLWRLSAEAPQVLLEPAVPIDRALALATSPIHPDHVVLAYRTTSGGVVVSRWTRSGDVFDPTSENVIFSNPFSAPETATAAIAFDADGLLFAAFGDDSPTAPESTAAEDPSTLAGTVARVDIGSLDATGIVVPPDNPSPLDFGSPGSQPTRTWAIGVRRPTGAFVSDTGRLWLADQGVAVGEVHAVPKARDLGWPRYDGFVCNEPTGCGVELDKLPQSTVETTDACPLLLGTTSTAPSWPSLDGMLY